MEAELTIARFSLECIAMANVLFYLVLHCIYKKFRYPPGNIIVWQLAGLVFYFTAMLYWDGTIISGGLLTNSGCRAQVTLIVFGELLMSLYLFCLCNEIYIVAKNPLDKKYNKRANIFHIVSQTISILVVIVLTVLVDIEATHGGELCGFANDLVGAVIFGLTEILDIISFILIILSIKVMKSSQRYLYRYIAFCIAEFCNDTLTLIWQFITNEAIKNTMAIWIILIYLFMATWRILEVTVLNSYFNSLKRHSTFLVSQRAMSYIPPSQSLFQACMISTIQALQYSLALIFQYQEQDSPFTDFQMIEIQPEGLKSVEYNRWKLQKLHLPLYSELDQLQGSEILITEYAPSIFQKIRDQNQVSNSYLQDLFQNQDVDQIRKNVGNPGGASDAFFYFTSDKRFIMKTITTEEKKMLFKGFLKDYSNHIRDSLLARIYGVYEIKVGTQQPFSIMLIGNVALTELEVIAQFDLKGSTVNRKVHGSTAGSIFSLDPKTVYKDQDFQNFVGNVRTNSPNMILEKIKSDSKFLEERNIMDYSILLKICKPSEASSPFIFHGEQYTCCIGIIDFLQKYTWAKHAELGIKSVFKEKEQISCQNPETYGKRFVEKMAEYLYVDN